MSVRRAPLVAAALFALVLTGCDSGSDSPSGAANGPSVLVPGLPGEDNRTLSADEAADQRDDDDTPNSADVDYATMMIEHHEQALVMTALVPARGEAKQVKAIAARIAAAQGPEIEAMKSWLTSHNKAAGKDTDGKDGSDGKDGMDGMDAGGHDGGGAHHGDGDGATGGTGTTGGAHDTSSMPGMATEAQLKELKAARGKAFDRLFLALMITHHEGAVTMATDVKGQGNNIRIEEMADEVVAVQTTEISKMRAML